MPFVIKFAREPLAVGLALVLAVAGLEVVAAVPAAAAGAPAGTYVAFAAPSRVASARTVRAGRVLTVNVAGTGRVPRSGVGAVAVTLTATGATAGGALVAYGTHRPSTTNLQFVTGSAVTDTAIVPVSGGRIHVRNAARRGSVKVSVDVSGYYRAGAASGGNPGVFHVLPTARRLSSVRIGAHASANVAVGGHAGVPAEPGAAALTLTVTGATRSGTVVAHRPDEPVQNLPVVRFAARRPVSSFAVVRVSSGRTTLVNTSSRAVRVAVDVAGWYVIGFAQSAGAFQTLVPTRVWSARVSGGRTAAVPVAGRGGVPLTGVTAVLAVVHAGSPARSGGVQAWRYGSHRPRTATALQFAAGRSVSNEVLIPVSSGGRIDLRNTSRGRVSLALDVHGYVPTTTVTPPASGSAARYVRTVDPSALQSAGRADAAAGASFVLLDIGAQANDKSGVVLSATTTEVKYGDLVDALSEYLAGFATNGHTGTVAVGTNNTADDWTNYPATERGADWAIQVVRPLVTVGAPEHVTVIGANDIEGAFFSTVGQAEQWKTAFLANMPGTGTALVYNGSADFCPKTWTRNAACNFGWTEKRVYGLAGGSRTMVLPQVYFGYMATQWAMINATGGGRLRFLGALSDHALAPGHLAPAQSWVALQRAMSSVTRAGVGRRVADLHA